MQTTRRKFLGGILAITAAAAMPKAIGAVPTIYADGTHDDAPGLNALLSGAAFRVQNEQVLAQEGLVKGGRFLIGSTLHVPPWSRISMFENDFVAAPTLEGVVMYIHDGAQYDIRNNRFSLLRAEDISRARFFHMVDGL